MCPRLHLYRFFFNVWWTKMLVVPLMNKSTVPRKYTIHNFWGNYLTILILRGRVSEYFAATLDEGQLDTSLKEQSDPSVPLSLWFKDKVTMSHNSSAKDTLAKACNLQVFVSCLLRLLWPCAWVPSQLNVNTRLTEQCTSCTFPLLLPCLESPKWYRGHSIVMHRQKRSQAEALSACQARFKNQWHLKDRSDVSQSSAL